MKKKILSLALVVALIAIVVGGSLAYFTDNDQVTNTFTIGSVKIDIEENFESPKTMVPVVKADETDPNYITKEACVKNTGDNNAYVQMFVAIPKALDDVGAFIVVDSNNGDWSDRVLLDDDVTIEGVLCNVYMYRYLGELDAGAATSEVIKAAYLAPQLDYDNENNRFVMDGVTIDGYIPGEEIDIYVAAQAIQSDGFADYDVALNSGFTTHPWTTN